MPFCFFILAVGDLLMFDRRAVAPCRLRPAFAYTGLSLCVPGGSEQFEKCCALNLDDFRMFLHWLLLEDRAVGASLFYSCRLENCEKFTVNNGIYLLPLF